jgi:hypothetical protein
VNNFPFYYDENNHQWIKVDPFKPYEYNGMKMIHSKWNNSLWEAIQRAHQCNVGAIYYMRPEQIVINNAYIRYRLSIWSERPPDSDYDTKVKELALLVLTEPTRTYGA